MVAVETRTETCHEIIETFIHEALAELAATEVVVVDESGEDNGAANGNGAAEEIGIGGQI